MPLFKKKPAQSQSQNPIAGFWDWWVSEGRQRADSALAAGDWSGFPETLGARLALVDPNLEWETGQGSRARHALTISAGGVAERRPLAERVVRAAPPADAVWEFHPARQPDADLAGSTLQFEGQDIGLDGILVSLTLDDDRARTDVLVFHPAFARLTENARLSATFLLLDWALGEDGVERWVGEVAVTAEQPADALPVDALLETVASLQSRTGDDAWAFGRGSVQGRPLLFTARRPFKWIDNPLLDLHVTLRAPFPEQTAEGFPASGVLDQLRALEDELERRLAGRGLLVAHETSGGVRTFHVYVDSEQDGVVDDLRPLPGVTVETAPDPGWRDVRRFG